LSCLFDQLKCAVQVTVQAKRVQLTRRIAQWRSWRESGCILTACIQRCGTMTLERCVADLYLMSPNKIFCCAGRSSRCNHKHMLQAVSWYCPLLKKVTSGLGISTNFPIRYSFQNYSSLKHAPSIKLYLQILLQGLDI
jgi:hypothetical protein